MVRELYRILPPSVRLLYEDELKLYIRVLDQKKEDKNKIYSLHKPYTDCIAKGKAYQPYEFGNKVGFLLTSKSLIITAVRTYLGNPHDSRTIEPLVEQLDRNGFSKPKEIVYDRAARGVNQVKGVTVSVPSIPLKRDSPYEGPFSK